MKYLKAMVLMQLKDKIDFSFTRSVKTIINKIVFTILKFAIVAAVAFGFFKVCSILGIFSLTGQIPAAVMIILLTLLLALATLSCTVGLMKTLYFADDNRLLITFPVTGNMVFMSKLVLYYIYELIRSVMVTVPIFVGFGLVSGMSLLFYPWLFIVFIFVSALPVVVGALLSIAAMWLLRFVKSVPYLSVVLFLAVIALCVYALSLLIGLIPEDINLVNSWGKIYWEIQDILAKWTGILYPMSYVVAMIIGRPSGFSYKLFGGEMFAIFGCFILIIAALFCAAYLIARPIFFKMMTRNFEFNKDAAVKKGKNVRHGKVYAFFVKEFRVFVRSELSYSFLAAYIAMPLMIYLLNKIFAAMNTRLIGQYMVYAFNLLIILLPVLAANSLIATVFSREGRAGYIKKSKPVNPLLPLSCKLIFPLVCSALSVAAGVIIFGGFSKFTAGQLVGMGIGLYAVAAGHIIISATMDLMNPQNEQYSTAGESYSNRNELSATLVAFVLSVVVAGFSYKLFTENVAISWVKLLLIGIVVLACALFMFVKKVKVYYPERMG